MARFEKQRLLMPRAAWLLQTHLQPVQWSLAPSLVSSHQQTLTTSRWVQKEEDTEDPDAESRMNAVKALAACAMELYTRSEASQKCSASAAGSDADAAQAASPPTPSLGSNPVAMHTNSAPGAAAEAGEHGQVPLSGNQSPVLAAQTDGPGVQAQLQSAVHAATSALNDYSIDNR